MQRYLEQDLARADVAVPMGVGLVDELHREDLAVWRESLFNPVDR